MDKVIENEVNPVSSLARYIYITLSSNVGNRSFFKKLSNI